MSPSVHGYSLPSDYSLKFYRELAPSWIDISLLRAKILPPRPNPWGRGFNYIELGCGLGLTLVFLAAYHPEGSFLGIDYSASHISKARQLANRIGIKNVRFIQADLVNVSNNPSRFGIGEEAFDYVVAHGLMTWVSPEVQQSVLELTAHALVCGGAFYCSYNCYPGWLSASIIQHVYQLAEKEISNGSDSVSAYSLSKQYLNAIQTERPHVASPVKANYPTLEAWLNFMDQQDSRYIQQEFGPNNWRPVYSSDFHRRAGEYQLFYGSSCTQSDALRELLSQEVQDLLNSISDPLSHASIEDISCNRSFRRDIFVKGPTTINQQHALSLAGDFEIILTRSIQHNLPLELNGPYGTIYGDPKAYGPVLEFLSQGHRPLSDLFSKLAISPADCLNRVLLLLDKGIAGICTTSQQPDWNNKLYAANMALIAPQTLASFCGYLMAPMASNAIPIDPASAIILSGIYQNLTGSELNQFIRKNLEDMGAVFADEKGDPIVRNKEINAYIEQEVLHFKATKLEQFRHLGAVR